VNLERLQNACERFLGERLATDPAHDLSHVRRVVKNTIYLTDIEQANELISVPAAWLHDCVSVPKDSPDRDKASRLAAERAVAFLDGAGYPAGMLDEVFHAIEAHSFSASVPPRTLEAKIVQDADRLEALGAIGIARCLLTGGSLGTQLYEPDDPFCEAREPEERKYAIDHFYQKLFRLPETMQTAAGQAEAQRRAGFMREYLRHLDGEINGDFRKWA